MACRDDGNAGAGGSVRYLCWSILALPFRASVSLRWWSGLRLCCTGKGGQYADDGAEVEGGGDAEEGEERGRQNQQQPLLLLLVLLLLVLLLMFFQRSVC